MPMKARMPVTVLMPNPASAHGINRCNGAIGSGFANPSIRRLRIPTVPINKVRPMKCKSIMKAHHHLLMSIRSLNFTGDGSR